MKNKTNVTVGSGDNEAEVSLRKSRLAKRVMIKYSNRKGFELVVPARISMKHALNFLYKKEDWVLEKNALLKKRSRRIFAHGEQVPILGELYTINYSVALRGITRIDGNQLLIFGLEEHIPRKTKQFLVKLAKEKISSWAASHASRLEVRFNRIGIRDTTTRWGSCSHSGNLSFSWRLVMAPESVLEYVVVHELAHLLEMNHSKKFWEVVASIFPNYKKARGWLKANGGDLHYYG